MPAEQSCEEDNSKQMNCLIYAKQNRPQGNNKETSSSLAMMHMLCVIARPLPLRVSGLSSCKLLSQYSLYGKKRVCRVIVQGEREEKKGNEAFGNALDCNEQLIGGLEHCIMCGVSFSCTLNNPYVNTRECIGISPYFQ